MKKKYKFIKIEKNIQKIWNKKKFYKIKKNKKKKYYCLPMLPYPSGKLHLGHVRNYTISDVISRYQRMLGKNVLQPIGWDSFGLPAEIAAIKNKKNPKSWTKKNIVYMKKQLKSLGFSYDWSREISTCNPKYYKWEQWLFKKLYKKKLIYEKKSFVKWCKNDKTVLANEQVINGKCWRCDSKITVKKINQWFLKIRNYAEELYQGLKTLKGWPKKVKKMQKNWIGRSKGIEINIYIKKYKKIIKVYTKKPYSIKKSLYIAISPENKIIQKIIKNNKKLKKFVYKQIKNLANSSNLKKIKNIGKNTNIFVKTPFKKKKIPIWIANFVSIKYGNNAILASPYYSKSEFSFFKKNKMNKKILKKVTNFNKKFIKNIKKKKKKYTLKSKNIIKEIIKKKIGKKKISYKIQNWSISRQRYWGTPIPVLKNKKNEIILTSNKKLPILLSSYSDFKKLKKLKKNYSKKIKNYEKFFKETDTFDTFIESSWYYARYTCRNYKKKMIHKKSSKYWLPIDQYIGGIEHANMHLIYIRFFHKLLRDLNFFKINEPIKNLLCQGMVLSKAFYYIKENKKHWIKKKNVKIIKNKDNKILKIIDKKGNFLNCTGMIKMSKSKNNGINPQSIIKKYGADTLRLFIMFSAPVESDLLWKNKGIVGINRFLKKLWKLYYNFIKNKNKIKHVNVNKENKKNRSILHEYILKITKLIEKKFFNSSIANIMKLVKIYKKLKKTKKLNNLTNKEYLICIIKMLFPFAPHFSFYILKKLKKIKHKKHIKWPKSDSKIIKKYKKSKIIIFQIDGKTIYKIKSKKELSKNTIFKTAIKERKIFLKLKNKKIIKKIFIKNKLLNIVIKKKKKKK
ncbi:leucine--tRNA ligase [Buchnera aphidicola]